MKSSLFTPYEVNVTMPYDGMSRAEAAKVGGMDRQTLRDWAHRFNEEGPEGLKHRAGAGRRLAAWTVRR